MNTIYPKTNFTRSGYYFTGLLVLAFLGFWNSYFSKFFTGKNDFSFYFHVHAAMMVLWVALLITQPLLIRKKKLRLHRIIGKAAYFIMPLLLISVLLVLNSGMKKVSANEITFNMILFPFRDLILLIVAFSIGICYRKNIQIHARAMIITGIVFIEPALFRFLEGMLFKNMGVTGGYIGMGVILTLLVTLIITERKQKKGRWLFPSLLAVYMAVYSIAIFNISLTFLDPLAKWFARLPLT